MTVRDILAGVHSLAAAVNAMAVQAWFWRRCAAAAVMRFCCCVTPPTAESFAHQKPSSNTEPSGNTVARGVVKPHRREVSHVCLIYITAVEE
jgi:hypothetical protein